MLGALVVGSLVCIPCGLAEPLKFTLLKTESLTLSGDIVGRYFSVEFAPVREKTGVTAYLIAIFEDRQIPYYRAINPLVVQRISCPAPRCSLALEAPISELPYIVGIGSGDSVDSISATLNFSPGTASGRPFQAALEIKSLRINSLIVSYILPPGYRPSRSGAWLGLWAGSSVEGVEPLAKAEIDSDLAQDTQAINGLTIQSNFTYTVGLAAGPGVKGITSLAVFRTEGY
ncbi:hypothetical protein MJ904_20860 [Massilia sp. MB5]|uniref:hypothetical protein n=1 Tax=Massilia sp. MB5 TaxID=2919578 RepID=UPI001F0E957C|nr:hypothetical protein [Massilia sp. MB5]UMR29490.1 hypothetical protein MJ904_20860 [Massilia sp. MB5]